MTRDLTSVRWLVAILTLASLATPTGGQTPESDVFALLRTIDQAAVRQVWPGFHLSDWPVAVYDGTRTLLLRHPNPPPEFKPLPDRPGIRAFPGRYPAVAGNSTVDIAGTRTGTVVATPGSAAYSGASPTESTLLAYVEEVFHVFWLRRHASFRPNEMARYGYPVKDTRNLQRVLAEDEALARGLEAPDNAAAAGWAATVLQLRREREALLTADDLAFEVGLEMMEGTANYVARVMVGLTPAETARRLRERRAAEQFRWRYYDSGTAICLLLDRLQPEWKTRIDSEPTLTTMALLEAAVTRMGARPAPFTAQEMSSFEKTAAAAIEDLSARQARLREELGGRSGPRVILELRDGEPPFRVTRFDPINLLVLDAGEIVHPRYLSLEGPAGTVTFTNPAYTRGSFDGIVALTRPAGRHPLGGGVRSLTVVGLSGAPAVDRQEGQIVVETEGLRIVLRRAALRTEGETLHITIGGPDGFSR